jgi:hypothetical protein
MSIFHVGSVSIFYKTVILWHFWGEARSPDIKMASMPFLYLEIFTV